MHQELMARESLRLRELLAAIDVFVEANKDMPLAMLKADRGPNEVANRLAVSREALGS
jgi:hypothetical protein